MPKAWYYEEIRNRDRKLREQGREIERLERELAEEKRKREQAEAELKHIAERKASKKPRFPDYSVSTQEKKMTGKKRKTSPGRRTTLEKIQETTLTKVIYPKGVPFDACHYVRSWTVTRLIDGKATLVLYRIFASADGKQGEMPDVLPGSEYGMEIAVALAILVYGTEVSVQQACTILRMFCGLSLSKSRADSLLQQLSVLWGKDFDALKEILLLSMVVHMDETGWKISETRCYTWIFTTLLHTVLLYGQTRAEDVLDAILPRDVFQGIGVTDCLKIYEKRFRRAQKCWAHFLRTAIRLMLSGTRSAKTYKAFFEGLYAIFAEGKRAQQDATLTEKEREQKTQELQQRILALCTRHREKIPANASKEKREFLNLQKRLVRNIDDLFTFVLIPQVEATNNRAERGFRKTAKARNNYQTSKTKKGADRRSIIASVLTSLQQNLQSFTLQSITEEVVRWRTEGVSLFQRQLQLMRAGASP